MKRPTAILFFAIFLFAANLFAGGPACKVIIDYSSLIRSATDLSDLAAAQHHPVLAAEAHSQAVSSYGGWVGALEIVEYSSPSQVKRILDQSYLVCDWAKEVRGWCAALRSGPVAASTIDAWITKMQRWQDADEALIRGIAEESMPQGYVRPVRPPERASARQ